MALLSGVKKQVGALGAQIRDQPAPPNLGGTGFQGRKLGPNFPGVGQPAGGLQPTGGLGAPPLGGVSGSPQSRPITRGPDGREIAGGG